MIIVDMDALQLVISISLFLMLFVISFRQILCNKRFNNDDRLPLPPGPKPWPIIGNLPHLGAVPHQSLAAMARTYGPLLHLKLGSVHVVVAASASVASQFLKTHDANFANRPPNAGAKYMAYNYQDLVFAPYGPKWRFLRKICFIHLFSTKALDRFCHVRQEEVALLNQTLVEAARRKEQVKLGQLLIVCTTNAIGRSTLGYRVFGGGSSEGERSSEEFKKMVVELLVLAGQFNIGDFIPSLQWLDLQGVVSKMKKLHRRFDDFLNKIVQEHKENNGTGGHKDFLSILLQLKDNADGDEEGTLTDANIKALLLNLFVAGTDTSSSTVEWVIAELVRHPEVLGKAQNELDLVVGRDRLVIESDLSQLTYFQAIIKETFRLHPPTPLSVPRVASESCEINGYLIPKNSTLLVNVWAIGRDPDVWPNPLEFQPERFLGDGGYCNVDVKENDFEVMPFGGGRRICAGLGLGLRMVQLVAASLVHGFEWELPKGEAKEKLNMEEAYGLTLQKAVPLVVHPKLRLPLHAYTFNSGFTCE